jgi:hypothetical protein
MARPCTVCRHANRSEIDSALINGQSLRNIAKQFRIGATAVFRHKRDHIPKTLVKAAEADAEIQEVARGEDLLEQVRDLNQRTLRILQEAEKTGDSRTALAAVREARGNAELLCKMIVAMEAAKHEEDSQDIITSEMLDRFNTLIYGTKQELPEKEVNTLNPQPAECKEAWIERMVNASIHKATAE